MKLTKEIINVLKYHGFMTSTDKPEAFLKAFSTVEALGDAGFITDRGAVKFLKTIFDENGVNRSAEVGEQELEKQAVEVPEEPVVEPDPNAVEADNENSQGPSGEFDGAPVETPEEPVAEPEPEKVEEPVEEPVAEPEPEKVEGPVEEPAPSSEPEPTADAVEEVAKEEENKVEEPEPEKVSEVVEQPAEEAPKVEEKPKPKKTTTKKSTKKES